MKMLHVILTRFNLRSPGLLRDSRNRDTLTRVWYEERFQLFEDICYPSIVGQLEKKFHWIIFFDTSTPEEYLERIRQYPCSAPKIKTVFINGMDHFLEGCRQAICPLFTADSTHVATTRLDNDDALSRDFTGTVQELVQCPSRGEMLVDFIDGCSMRIEQGRLQLRRKRLAFGPFLTLIEPVKDFETVYSVQHHDWENRKYVENLQIRNQFVWLQTVHGRNLANRTREFDYLASPGLLDRFDLRISRYKIHEPGILDVMDYVRVCLAKTIRLLFIAVLPASAIKKIKKYRS